MPLNHCLLTREETGRHPAHTVRAQNHADAVDRQVHPVCPYLEEEKEREEIMGWTIFRK